MEHLIEDALKLQQGVLPKGTINAFNSLKSMPLENLRIELEKAQVDKNTTFVSTIGIILDFGTINSNLDDYERAIMCQKISAKSELEKIKELLAVYEELRAKIEPSLIDHPLVREYQYFKDMQILAGTQDKQLIDIANSYPQSILWLPSDLEKDRLIELYCRIKTFKGVDYKLFNETVMSDILKAINNNGTALSLICLRNYLDGKNATLSNLDEEIQSMHIEARASMPSAQENLKATYIETSTTLERTQKEYLTLKKTLAKYQYPKND